MMIEILGNGCPKCKLLEENAREAVKSMGLTAEIVKVTDIDRMIDYGVMSTPAIVIDGVVKLSGRIARVDEIKDWLR
jgi:small redox-active disulfide protein 2